MTPLRDRAIFLGVVAVAASLLLPGGESTRAWAGSATPQAKPETSPAPGTPAANPGSNTGPNLAPNAGTGTPAPVGNAPAAVSPLPSTPPSTLPGNITPQAAPAPSTTTPSAASTLPAPSIAQQKAKVKETTLTGLDDGTGKGRKASRHAHRREPWPRVSYRASYYNPYCGPPPAFGVYVVRIR